MQAGTDFGRWRASGGGIAKVIAVLFYPTAILPYCHIAYYINLISTPMKKTVRDLEKAGSNSIKWLEAGTYYLYLPVVLVLGLKTVKWEAFFSQPPSLA